MTNGRRYMPLLHKHNGTVIAELAICLFTPGIICDDAYTQVAVDELSARTRKRGRKWRKGEGVYWGVGCSTQIWF